MTDLAALFQMFAESPIPGIAFGVTDATATRIVHIHGFAQREPAKIPLDRKMFFDLASLTKVIFTTSAVLRLVAEGHIALDYPLTAAIPDLRQYDLAAAERRLTFRQCLSHQTHLPAVEPLYTYGQDSRTLRAFILQRVWKAGPPVYSDINFLLLGIAIERLTGRPLIDQPLPDGFSFAPDPRNCVATERCAWRERVLRGEVHDENAFAFGGAAGHAGLFGTIDGVLAFARGLLDGTGLPGPAIAAIRARQAGSRAIGWETSHEGWSGGDACSHETIGHTGFTGTGLWLDFSRRIAWSLLTNRVHPSRHRDTGIATLRRAAGDAVIAAFQAG